MADTSVHQWIGEDQTGVGVDWEEESYRQGCSYARELAEGRLKSSGRWVDAQQAEGTAVGEFTRQDLGDSIRRCDHRTPDVSRYRRLDSVPLWMSIWDGSLSNWRVRRSPRAWWRWPRRCHSVKVGRSVSALTAGVLSKLASALMSAAGPAETTTAIRDRRYVESNLSNGVDWRNCVPNAPPDARSLGTMESNGDKLIANRMKKRGMSWTIRRAQRMAKVIQLSRNGELSRFCHRRPVHGPVQGRWHHPTATDR